MGRPGRPGDDLAAELEAFLRDQQGIREAVEAEAEGDGEDGADDADGTEDQVDEDPADGEDVTD